MTWNPNKKVEDNLIDTFQDGGIELDLFIAEPDKTLVASDVDLQSLPKHVPNKNIVEAAAARAEEGIDTYRWVNRRKVYGNMCASFVCDVFKDAGVAIPYSENAGRLAKNLDEDSNYMKIDNKEDMQAGDIILFPGGGPSGIHVGITAEDYTEPSWEWGNWGGGISVYHEQGKYVKPLKTNYTGYELDHTKKFKGAYRYIGE